MINGAKTNGLTVIKQRDNTVGTNNVDFTVSGNSIGVAASTDSGSSEGDGIELTGGGDGIATFNVTNNNGCPGHAA